MKELLCKYLYLEISIVNISYTILTTTVLNFKVSKTTSHSNNKLVYLSILTHSCNGCPFGGQSTAELSCRLQFHLWHRLSSYCIVAYTQAQAFGRVVALDTKHVATPTPGGGRRANEDHRGARDVAHRLLQHVH